MSTIEIPEKLLETYDSDKIRFYIMAREKYRQFNSLMEYLRKRREKNDE